MSTTALIPTPPPTTHPNLRCFPLSSKTICSSLIFSIVSSANSVVVTHSQCGLHQSGRSATVVPCDEDAPAPTAVETPAPSMMSGMATNLRRVTFFFLVGRGTWHTHVQYRPQRHGFTRSFPLSFAGPLGPESGSLIFYASSIPQGPRRRPPLPPPSAQL